MTIFSLPTFSYSPPPPSPLLHTLGARVGVRPPPPPLGAVLQLFSPCGSLIATYFSLRGTYFTMWGPFWYIFLFMWNLFYHVGAFLVHFSPYGELFLPCGGLFSPCGGLWLRFHPYWDLFFYHVGRQSYHVGDFLLRFSFYWELVLPCGGIFATFFSIWGAFLYIWGAFLYIYVGPFCTYGGEAFFVHMGGILGPPRTSIPARPRVPIVIPHQIIMPAITV